mgnify:CR=1 FL=1
MKEPLVLDDHTAAWTKKVQEDLGVPNWQIRTTWNEEEKRFEIQLKISCRPCEGSGRSWFYDHCHFADRDCSWCEGTGWKWATIED